MSLPPERISIKRRRQEEPVDTLIIEQSSDRDKKRQFTDFCFQRLRTDQTSISSSSQQVSSHSPNAENDFKIDYQAFGIPVVKTSAPGDEVTDFTKYRASQRRQIDVKNESVREDTNKSLSDDIKVNSPSTSRRADQARRFHLTRDLSSALRPNSSGGIRRRKLNLRPPLATFVERHRAQYVHEAGSIHQKPPVDRIVHMNTDLATKDPEVKPTPDCVDSRTPTSTFLKPKVQPTRRGQSIRDDPNTWDLESDQLANELARLALEFDPDPDAEEVEVNLEKTKKPASVASIEPMAVDNDKDNDNDFVIETYVRVRLSDSMDQSSSKLNTDFGILVIGEEDEELWEKYIQSDEEDDWDDEDVDSNAEDNPRNDYPEDEVSTDDEYDNNIYKYRHNASDDEEFERDEW